MDILAELCFQGDFTNNELRDSTCKTASLSIQILFLEN